MFPNGKCVTPAGRSVPIDDGYWAFVPCAPTGELDYDAATVAAITLASGELGRLDGIAGGLPSVDLLMTPYTRIEAVRSSQIEGTRTSLADLLQSEVDSAHVPAANDLDEVRNYVRAQDYGARHLSGRDFSLKLVCALHTILTSGVRGGAAQPGQFRDAQVHIGPPGGIEYAVYIPPPPTEIARLMGEWEDFVQRPPANMPALVHAALVHCYFEAIHPFRDGNGRIGRLLTGLLLCNSGLTQHPVLYLSPFIEAHRRDYYDLLLAVSRDGDWTGWLRFFLAAVAGQARQTARFCDEVMELRTQLQERLREATRSPNAFELLDQLFGNPFLTVPVAAERMGVSRPVVRKLIALLADMGVVEEREDRKRNKLYCAPQLLDLIERASEVTGSWA